MKHIHKMSDRELRQELAEARDLIRRIAKGLDGELAQTYMALCSDWLKEKDK